MGHFRADVDSNEFAEQRVRVLRRIRRRIVAEARVQLPIRTERDLAAVVGERILTRRRDAQEHTLRRSGPDAVDSGELADVDVAVPTDVVDEEPPVLGVARVEREREQAAQPAAGQPVTQIEERRVEHAGVIEDANEPRPLHYVQPVRAA